MHRAFVAGATGYVGREVVASLAARGPRTRAIAHVRPDSPSLLDWQLRFAAAGAEVDSTPWQTEALAATLRQHAVSHVFCLIGTTRQRARREHIAGDRYRAVDLGLTRLLCDAAVASGAAPRFVYLSSVGADPRARSAYLRARGEAEAHVVASGLPYLIARPSFVTGADRDEPRPGERAAAALADGALAAMAALGARRLQGRWSSISGPALARALVALTVERGQGGVVDASTLRHAAAL
jgi:uncharacterized protein YbjT (DUF2867 family)